MEINEKEIENKKKALQNFIKREFEDFEDFLDVWKFREVKNEDNLITLIYELLERI